MHRFEILKFLEEVVEMSVYLAPDDYGMSAAEIIEVADRFDIRKGEVQDLLRHTGSQFRYVSGRFVPTHHVWMQGMQSFNPDYRNKRAFEFVLEEMRVLAREQGVAAARIEHSVLVARAKSRQLPDLDVRAAISILMIDKILIESGGGTNRILSCASPGPLYAFVDVDSCGSPGSESPRRKETYQVVADVIARRTDGRPAAAEATGAFAEALSRLRYEKFHMWWKQLVSELKMLNPSTSAVSICVLSAALIEGALTFVVRHARTLDTGVFGSKTFAESPQTWRINDLIKGAAGGGKAAILNENLRLRAVGLTHTRQRIHAGRMLAESPEGVPDIRPEEAIEARAVVDLVLRAIMDWLERYPPES